MQLVDHHVSYPVVRSFWVNEYAGYTDSFRGEAFAPIQNKIGKALMVPRETTSFNDAQCLRL